MIVESLFEILPLSEPNGKVQLAAAMPNEQYRNNSSLPRSALPEFGRIASGRGATMDECRQSCLGEAAELLCSCEWGNEPLITAREEDIAPYALAPRALNGFTADQIRGREDWNRDFGDVDWRPAELKPNRSIEWFAVDNAFGGQKFYAPADFVFIGRRERGDEAAVAIGDSNGCAAGPDSCSAKLAAILELIERDATARWWYGRRRRAPIDIRQIRAATELEPWLTERDRHTWLFDLTTDLNVPVAAAVSAEASGLDVALGFSAKINWPAAAHSAATEMLQMEFSLDVARMDDSHASPWSRWRRSVTMSLPPLDATAVPHRAALASSAWDKGDITFTGILESCARANIDIWFADLARPEIGVPVYRALSKALCHYKPRFARERLLARDHGDTSRKFQTPATQVPLLV